MTRHNPGLRGDVDRLKEHGGASLGELQEFLRQLHGRSPSEVLGIVSGNSLIRALCEATFYLAAVIAVLTVVPYMMHDDAPAKPVAAAASSPASSNVPASAPTAAAAAPAPTAASEDSLSEVDAQKAADVMGLGETKTADPNVNPLDNLDNLLDDVE